MRACLAGNEHAWAALIDKYKNLIYSIPVKYGAGPDDAADVFQSVCLELFSHLSDLRNVGALRGWLITVATHQAFHWKLKQRKRADREQAPLEDDVQAAGTPLPSELTAEAEREQFLREALRELPPRCQELIRLLFYTEPPLPYRQVAHQLGLATGSIGFIRGRCLQRLRRNLDARGF